MRSCFVLIPLLLSGCVSKPQAARTPPRPAEPLAAVPSRTATRLVETRYELREYHDASDPLVRHDAHAVYRATRVPLRPNGQAQELATVPRASFAPASFHPLSRNDELAAELATQRQITSELRAIQTAMSATQKDAEAKFSELVNQTAETVRLRRELEQERTRVKELQVDMRDQAERAQPSPSSPATKW